MTCLQIQFSTSKSNQLASRILSINGRAQNQEGNDTHGHSVHNPSPKILHRSISQKRAPRAKQSSPFQGPYWRPSSDAKTNGPQCPNPPLWPIRHGLRIILNLWIFEVFSHDIWRPSKRVCFFFRWRQVLMTWKRFTTARHLMDLKPSNFLLTKAEVVHRIFHSLLCSLAPHSINTNYSRLEEWKMQKTLAMGYSHSVSINK